MTHAHMTAEVHTQSHMRLITAAVLLTFALAVTCTWKLTPAAQYLSPPMIANLFQEMRNNVWAVPAVIGIYILGSMVFFPLTIMILATALVFPPLEACAVALAGSLSSACLGYAIGRFSGVNPMRFIKGRSAQSMRRYTQHAGVLGVAILRMVPLLPLGLVDIGLGMAHIPLSTYLIATLIGLLPGILALSLLGHSLGSLWYDHNLHALLYVGLAILCWVGIAVASHFLVRYWHHRNDHATPTNE